MFASACGFPARVDAWAWSDALGIRRARLVLRGAAEEWTLDADGSCRGVVHTASLALRDEFERLSLHAALSPAIMHARARDGVWRVTMSNADAIAQPTMSICKSMKRTTRVGSVWCVTVPTRAHLICFRRVLSRSPDGAVLAASRAVVVGNTIRDLRLPNNVNNILTSFEEEQVSTALGHVCHLLCMLAKLLEVRRATLRTAPTHHAPAHPPRLLITPASHVCLCACACVIQVPLRYRMIYRASRSVICDDVTASSQFPLYFKNMVRAPRALTCAPTLLIH
jgi:hypothetical protein